MGAFLWGDFMKKILILLVCFATMLQSFTLQSGNKLDYTLASAEVATAVTSGFMSYYNQKSINELGTDHKETHNKKMLLAFARLANNGLSLWKSLKLHNKQINDPASGRSKLDEGSYFKSVCELSWMAKNFAIIYSELHYTEEPKSNAPSDSAIKNDQDQKISDFARAILTYVLPAIEGFAATARAIDSFAVINATNTNSSLRNLNPDYWCTVILSLCYLLEEFMEQDKTDTKKILTVCQAIVFATLILFDTVPSFFGKTIKPEPTQEGTTEAKSAQGAKECPNDVNAEIDEILKDMEEIGQVKPTTQPEATKPSIETKGQPNIPELVESYTTIETTQPLECSDIQPVTKLTPQVAQPAEKKHRHHHRSKIDTGALSDGAPEKTHHRHHHRSKNSTYTEGTSAPE